MSVSNPSIPQASDLCPAFAQLQARQTRLSVTLDQLDANTTGAKITRDLSQPAIVTMIGQVKAGKTALTNALAGRANLLPMDVNPWTSVVTSLNFNQIHKDGSRAVFQFFAKDEWSELVSGGGRLGEIARNADRQDELSRLRAQVDEMHAHAKARLGRNFELLLGSFHRFDQFDSTLLERYICLGDDYTGGPIAAGRYADMTRSAELYLEGKQFGVPFTLRDTPGVNDPFLVREQITLRALADASICLVVLSAHQALTTTDLGLIRVLSSLQREQIVLFVNRIDELPTPAAQIPEIERRIRDTLKMQGLSGETQILFGSALWATAALEGDLTQLPQHSQTCLEQSGVDLSAPDAHQACWNASGIEQLREVIGQVVANGIGARRIDDTCRAAVTVARQQCALLEQQSASRTEIGATKLPEYLTEQLDPLLRSGSNALEMVLDSAIPKMNAGMREAVSQFADRECDRLRGSLNDNAKGKWQADSQVLRRNLAHQHAIFAKTVQDGLETTLTDLAKRLTTLYQDILGSAAAPMAVTPPNPPIAKPPVVISGAMTLDMDRTWWNSWFGLTSGTEARVKELRRLINVETRPILDSLRDDNVLSLTTECREILKTFLTDHSETLLQLTESTDTQQTRADISLRLEKLRAIERELTDQLISETVVFDDMCEAV